MAFSLTRSRDEIIDDLEQQVTSMKREIASLRKQAAKRGAHAYDDASELAGELYDRMSRSGAIAGREIARGARGVDRTARENPVATAVLGVAAIGVLFSLLMRR